MVSNETPPLDLSDIMHPLSPSPAPVPPETPSEPPAEPPPVTEEEMRPISSRSPSPEPVDQLEFHALKEKIKKMGLLSKDTADLTPKEKELARIVLRLTSVEPPDPSQIVRQAETIAQLTRQRDFLIRQAEDARERWDAEKEGWNRMAEALIAHHAKSDHSTYRDEELVHQVASLDADNRSLRQKLQDSQNRNTQLQNELFQLRPILLMQPLTLPEGMQMPQAPKSVRKTKPRNHVPPSPGQFDPMSEDNPESGEDNDINGVGPATPNAKGKGKADYYRRTDGPGLLPSLMPQSATKSKKGKGKGKNAPAASSSRPVFADARTEHILLAAHRIGKERAGKIAGITKVLRIEEQTREQERERQRAEMANARIQATPRTPRRNATATNHTPMHVTVPHFNQHPPQPQPQHHFQPQPHFQPHPQPQPHPQHSHPHNPYHYPQAYAYLPISVNGAPAGPVLVPIAPGQFPLPPQAPQTPHAPRTPSTVHSATPHTPLQSLVDAAAHLQGEDGPSTPTPTRSGRAPRADPYAHGRPAPALDFPGSSVPKRRRVNANSNAGAASSSKAGATQRELARERSGLDVLADEALTPRKADKGKAPEQSQSQSQPQNNMQRPRTRLGGKGKNRADIMVVSRSPSPGLDPESEDSEAEVHGLALAGSQSPASHPLPGTPERSSTAPPPPDTPDTTSTARAPSTPTDTPTPGAADMVAQGPVNNSVVPAASPVLAAPIALSRSRSEDGPESVAMPLSRNGSFMAQRAQLLSRRGSSIPPRFVRMPSSEVDDDIEVDSVDQAANAGTAPG